MYARVGTPFCPVHKLPLQSQSVSQMVDATLRLPLDTRVMVLAPMLRERKGEFSEFFDDMQTQGLCGFASTVTIGGSRCTATAAQDRQAFDRRGGRSPQGTR